MSSTIVINVIKDLGNVSEMYRFIKNAHPYARAVSIDDESYEEVMKKGLSYKVVRQDMTKNVLIVESDGVVPCGKVTCSLVPFEKDKDKFNVVYRNKSLKKDVFIDNGVVLQMSDKNVLKDAYDAFIKNKDSPNNIMFHTSLYDDQLILMVDVNDVMLSYHVGIKELKEFLYA
jgi:hypothetical protein